MHSAGYGDANPSEPRHAEAPPSLGWHSRRGRKRGSSRLPADNRCIRAALLFDLDETLVDEASAAADAFEATAAFAASEARGAVDPTLLVAAVRAQARELWSMSPVSDYCAGIGISSTEGLWCRFEGDHPITQALRRWAAVYREAAWASALAAQGLSDGGLAETLAERFASERRVRHRIFPDVAGTLSRLRKHYRLGLITNGASCLQWEKIDRCGLRRFFDVIVVSGDFGVGKPDSSIFRHALARFPGSLKDAVMLGDSIGSDIDGAQSVGLRAIWVNRLHHQRPPDRPALREVVTLADAEALLVS